MSATCNCPIHVCDCMMGSGKSSAAITFINEHPDRKFIYVTPFLAEAHRVAEACTNVKLFEPVEKKKYRQCKTLHTSMLVDRSCSVATTHQAFIAYPASLIQNIADKHYTLIIDENVSVMEQAKVKASYIRLALECGMLVETRPHVLELADKENCGDFDPELFHVMQTRTLLDGGGRIKYFWQLPPDLITAFDEVFVLTYMFRGQGLDLMFQLYNMEYDNISVRCTDGVYRFCASGDKEEVHPANPRHLITILDNEKLNYIGSGRTAMCKSWFESRIEREGDDSNADIILVKNHIYNFFKNIAPAKRGHKMWSTFASAELSLRGLGYTSCFVACNCRSTNTYKNATSLAYVVNLYYNSFQKTLLWRMGVKVDDDLYALSTLVQWIWRSAIRDGKPVTLYLPSRRMRELLEGWLNSFET